MPRFKSITHEKNYIAVLTMMESFDLRKKTLAYLLTLDPICLRHIHELYSFAEKTILVSGLKADWQTTESLKTTRLAFDLYEGSIELGSECRPSALFSDCLFSPFYFEAIRIRFPESFWKYELRLP